MNGLEIAADGSDLSKTDPQFNSNRSHLQVDLTQNPSHIGIIDTPTITRYANGTAGSETLFTLAHKFPFIPRLAVFFYCYDAPPGLSPNPIGQYTGGYSTMNRGFYTDVIYATADATNFYVKHVFSDTDGYLTNAGQVAQSDLFKYRIKYMVNANPAAKPRYQWDS